MRRHRTSPRQLLAAVAAAAFALGVAASCAAQTRIATAPTGGIPPASVSTPAGQSAGEQAAGAVQIKRPNLVVADLERSLRLYRDILGFAVFQISESGPTSYSYPTFKFPAGAKLRMATLSTAAAVRILALTEVTGVALPKVASPHRSAIVVEVKGIERIAERLNAEGLHVVASTTSKTPEGAVFIEQGFEDYDGHLVVMYEMRVR